MFPTRLTCYQSMEFRYAKHAERMTELTLYNRAGHRCVWELMACCWSHTSHLRQQHLLICRSISTTSPAHLYRPINLNVHLPVAWQLCIHSHFIYAAAGVWNFLPPDDIASQCPTVWKRHCSVAHLIHISDYLPARHCRYSLLRPPVEVRSVATYVCLSGCLFVCLFLSVCPLNYLKNIRPNFTKFSVHVTYGRGSVLFLQECNMLCTSGFVDDMFSHDWANGPESKTTRCFVEFARWRHRSLYIRWNDLPLDSRSVETN